MDHAERAADDRVVAETGVLVGTRPLGSDHAAVVEALASEEHRSASGRDARAWVEAIETQAVGEAQLAQALVGHLELVVGLGELGAAFHHRPLQAAAVGPVTPPGRASPGDRVRVHGRVVDARTGQSRAEHLAVHDIPLPRVAHGSDVDVKSLFGTP